MESAIQQLAAISFLVIGLSHILQPRVWAQFFIIVRGKGEVGSFLTAFLHLPMGAFIVSFHNVWRGIPIVLTLIGWAYVLKSLIYFTFPRYGLRMLAHVSIERSWEFIVPGVFMAVYGGLLAFSLLNK
jgi:hypothetical protein